MPKTKEEKRAYAKQYYQNNQERLKTEAREKRRQNPEWSLKYYHDLSLDEYNQLLAQQNNVCAICHNPQDIVLNGNVKRLYVDHCHITGKIRGLLCNNCNAGLGRFKDDPMKLINALFYLKQSGVYFSVDDLIKGMKNE